LTGGAVGALAAVAERLDGDTLTDFEPGDAFAEGGYLACILVPGRSIGRGREGSVIEMQVRSADSTGTDAYEDLTGRCLRFFDVADFDRLFGGVQDGFHAAGSSIPVIDD
jgi:hypothetical protein